MSEWICELDNGQRGKEPVVRCRDCKHCTQRDAIFPPIVCERWGYYNFKTEPDRFCAWGECKTEASKWVM